MGLGLGGDPRLPDWAGYGFCRASDVGEGHMTLGPVPVRVAGVWTDLLYTRGLPGPHPATLSTFFGCFISRSLSCGSDMMMSARCVSVLMTLILCSIGW